MSVKLEEEELQQLYQDALTELAGTTDELIVWAGGDAVNQQDSVAREFTKKFPKVPIDIKVDLSKNHDVVIDQELLNGDLTPDVVMLQTSNDFEDWHKMGVLQPFKPQGFANIRQDFKDPDGYFSVIKMFAFLPQYAKHGLAKPPTTIRDMLTGTYQNALVSTYPHDDDAVLYVFNRLIEQHGMQFLRAFARLNPRFVRGTAAPALLVGMNGILGCLTGYQTTPDQPSRSFIPASDFFISWGQRLAMFKLTKHQAAARLFLAFAQSTAFQKILGSYTVRSDLDSADTPWIGGYANTDPLGFYEFMRDRRHIHQLRKLMTDYFGPVVGESPVADHRMIKLTYGWPAY